jgi:hypothetical protein
LMSGNCRECKRPLIEIDNRGEHLRGCLTCNIWWANEKKVRLSEKDLAALHELRETVARLPPLIEPAARPSCVVERPAKMRGPHTPHAPLGN